MTLSIHLLQYWLHISEITNTKMMTNIDHRSDYQSITNENPYSTAYLKCADILYLFIYISEITNLSVWNALSFMEDLNPIGRNVHPS